MYVCDKCTMMLAIIILIIIVGVIDDEVFNLMI